MAYNSYLFSIIFAWINLFFSISGIAGNVSDIFDAQNNKEVPHATTLNAEKTMTFGSENKSYNDFECDCGYYSLGCVHVNGVKVCSCRPRFAQNGEACEECTCGYDSSLGCSFIAGEKICRCNAGYAQKGNKCEKCDCGDDYVGCSFENGKKTCNCRWGSAQKGDKCVDCECGLKSSKCNFENDKKECSCFYNYAQNSYGVCEECDCGYSEKCEFKGYTKECTCYNEYLFSPATGKCERCYCGPNATSCKLTFDKYARCTCAEGYVAERSSWEMDEYCKLPEPSGWKIATYVEAFFFIFIIFVCTVTICIKRYREDILQTSSIR